MLQSPAPGGISVGLITLRQLKVGDEFKLFNRYRDGERRPRLEYKPRRPSVLLNRAHLRLRGHAINGVTCRIEITRTGPNLLDTLHVVEHARRNVTIVADRRGRTAPLWSGIKLRERTGDFNGHR